MLGITAIRYAEWLGIDDVWQAMRDEYAHAKAKHGDNTFDNPNMDNVLKYMAIVEEVGEVAAAQTYDNLEDTGHKAHLLEEVVQVAGLACAWLAAYEDVVDFTN